MVRAASCTNKIHYWTVLWQEQHPVQTRYTIAQSCGKSCILYKQDTLLDSLVARAASCTNKIHYWTASWQELHPVQTRYTIAQPCGKSCILYKQDTLLQFRGKSFLLYKQDTLLDSLVARAASCTNKIHYWTASWQELHPVQTRYTIAQPCGKSCILYKQDTLLQFRGKSFLLYKQDTLLHSLVARAAACTNKIHDCILLSLMMTNYRCCIMK